MDCRVENQNEGAVLEVENLVAGFEVENVEAGFQSFGGVADRFSERNSLLSGRCFPGRSFHNQGSS